MRIFTIPHIELSFKFYRHQSSSFLLFSSDSSVEIGGNGTIIARSQFKNLKGKLETGCPFSCPVIVLHLLQDDRIVGTVGDYSD